MKKKKREFPDKYIITIHNGQTWQEDMKSWNVLIVDTLTECEEADKQFDAWVRKTVKLKDKGKFSIENIKKYSRPGFVTDEVIDGGWMNYIEDFYCTYDDVTYNADDHKLLYSVLYYNCVSLENYKWPILITRNNEDWKDIIKKFEEWQIRICEPYIIDLELIEDYDKEKFLKQLKKDPCPIDIMSTNPYFYGEWKSMEQLGPDWIASLSLGATGVPCFE